MQNPNIRPTDDYLVATIRSFIDAVRTGSKLWISGHDLRQALEVAIALKLSAQLGNLPVKLPLEDRSLTLLPSPPSSPNRLKKFRRGHKWQNGGR